MANPGIAPVDTSTPLGIVRGLIGDTNFVPLVPAVDGQGDYDYFGDSELQSLLAVAGGSTTRATGLAFSKLAVQAALAAASIKTEDLAISDITRADSLRQLAAQWLARADDEDRIANLDIFEIVPGPSRSYNVC